MAARETTETVSVRLSKISTTLTVITTACVVFCFVAAGNRKDKSLRIMSQKFVMLFLVSKTQTVTLDTAAKVLIEDSQDSSSHSKYKSKGVGGASCLTDGGRL